MKEDKKNYFYNLQLPNKGFKHLPYCSVYQKKMREKSNLLVPTPLTAPPPPPHTHTIIFNSTPVTIKL